MNPGDSCTPIYGFPFPTGNSDPCLVGSTGCDFAEAVEAQLDAIDIIIDGLTDVPFAYASNIAEMNYNNNNPGSFVMFFDTTLADTDDMIDLSLNPSVITIQTAGVYVFFVEVEMNVPNTGSAATVEFIIRNTNQSQIDGFTQNFLRFTQSTGMPVRTDGTRVANVAFSTQYVANCAVGYTASSELFISGSAGTVTNVQTYRLGALWLRSPL